MQYDKIIIGAGLYGLYAADICSNEGGNILVLEHDLAPFMRATYINQARVHSGYHYPRSISTAKKSIKYFKRFNEKYDFCINKKFEQVYAISTDYSWTSSNQFEKFCNNAGIRCDEVNPEQYFKKGVCSAAFLTDEYTYDAHLLRDYLSDNLTKKQNVTIKYGVRINRIVHEGDRYKIYTNKGNFYSGFILNATYASVNQIVNKVDGVNIDKFGIKYELCEIILCNVNDKLKSTGLTVMDGPFFSVMPFGKTGLHSLTSVTFTPHATSYCEVPVFSCQNEVDNDKCSLFQLGNCNECTAKPKTAWNYMSALAKKYMDNKYNIEYVNSLFSMKPILKAAEIDDSRPTAIKVHTCKPYFISVLSGKINTIFDLDDFLLEDKN